MKKHYGGTFLYLSRELEQKLQEIAEAEGRTVSNLVRRLLEKDLGVEKKKKAK